MALEGRAPTTRERLLGRSRDELAPHLSLKAVNEASERIVGAISVAATVASGLTLLGATTLSNVGWGWAIPAIVFSGASIILAVLAAIPSLTVIRPGDLEAVDEFFSRQIRRRGRLLRLAATALVLALLAIPIPAIVAAAEEESATVSVTAVRKGAVVAVDVQGEKLPAGSAELKATLRGRVQSLGLSSIPGSGSLEMTALVPRRQIRPGAWLEAIVVSGGDVVIKVKQAIPGGVLGDAPSHTGKG